MNEFEIIDHYFKNSTPHRSDVKLGIGDDGAIVRPPKNQWLVVATDTLVSGVHFFPHAPAKAIGHKALAVNLSDLAAMGADPAWATMSLTIPNINESWLNEFSEGFSALAKQYHVNLVGGDLTRGPLSITVHVIGFIPKNGILRRDRAQIGDDIFVSGTLGDAGAALQNIHHAPDFLLQRLNYPSPQIALGKNLRKIAHAVIDISDGLIADLGHILRQSKVGATIEIDQLPLSEALKSLSPTLDATELALTAGDDYELCFTVPPQNTTNKILKKFHCTRIGRIEQQSGLRLKKKDKTPYQLKNKTGFQHFI
ncbi:MAG: thiamine-phosphate kinase [Gammaproteobacteria bacterium]|nr:thiamine-phosphate kinase [Gammaproteobacteria bacterium]